MSSAAPCGPSTTTAADSRVSPASGNREWGVVDIDRHPKAAYWQMRKLYSPVHSIGLADGGITVQPRTSQEIPSYTLRGYHVAWKLSDSAGNVTASGTLALPDMAPRCPGVDFTPPRA